ncbi:MAG: hypothetical protein PHO79_10660 [Desulfoplanes sp.]|nr:hypothetical protein [Desulfoplanes sp.]
MKQKKVGLLSLIGVTMLSFMMLNGCSYPHRQAITSQTPIPNFHTISTQQICASVQHWETLANEVGDELQSRIKGSAVLYDKNVFVSMSGDTDFSKAFHNYLLTALLDRNIIPTNMQADNLILEYDIQIVKHNAYNRNKLTYIKKDLAPDFKIPYTCKLYGPENAQKEAINSTKKAYLTGLENLYPLNELIVTCSLIYNDKYIGRFNKSFYINNADIRLYRNKQRNYDSRLKTFAVRN